LWTIDAFYGICEVFKEVIIPSINVGVTVVAVPPISVELRRSSIPFFEVVFNEGVQILASRFNSHCIEFTVLTSIHAIIH
jgi:hypothetical protein